ncbi:MAG: hypothetical protein U5K69_04825 [Balneolaceae bacterium]|nr:hypothetical protein [Balneolaceae bacterium]
MLLNAMNFAGVGEATHGQHDRMSVSRSLIGTGFRSRSCFQGDRAWRDESGNERAKIKNLSVSKNPC